MAPRQVAVGWLMAESVADAVRYLPPATVEQFRAFQKTATTPEQQALVDMVEPMLAPLVFGQLMGGTLTATGSPVSSITLRGPRPLRLTILDASIKGNGAMVPLRIRTETGGPEEAGAIELRREGDAWRIVAANLGASITLPRFDSPDFVQTARVLAVEELLRDRTRMAEVQVAGRLRALISAQIVYAVHNNGFFAPPECLTNLAKCRPALKLDTSPLDAEMLNLRGYSSRFYPGPRPSASEISTAKAAPQSLKTWAHVFTPTDAASNVMAMCGDSTGRVCRLAAGRQDATGGACPATCTDVK